MKMSKRSPLSFSLATPVSPAITPAKPVAREPEPQPEEKLQPKASGRAGRQFIAAECGLPEAAKQFKLLAVQHDKTTQALLIEAINDLFTKYGLSRIADE